MNPSQSISTTTAVINGCEIVLITPEMKPGNTVRGHLTGGMQLSISYVWPHPVSFCPSELKPYIHQSFTLSYSHNILTKNSLPKCKRNKLKNLIGVLSFAFRRQKKERHSSYSQIYNYSSLKRIKWKLNKVL